MTDKKYVDSVKTGEFTERQLEILATKKGYIVTKSTKKQDIHEHIDYIFEDSTRTKKLTVDVKARKRISRDGEQQDEWMWVEFKNVLGLIGWLYGKADLIAFELENDFIIVKRKDLLDLCEKIVDKTKIVTSAKLAKYVGYKRFKRKDLISLINISDIKSLKHEIWQKI